jgi:adenosylhomocysteinase
MQNGLTTKGLSRIEWAGREMPVLNHIKKRFSEQKPLKGLKIGGCLHITAETANLALCLQAGGAEVFLCASNPLSTQDDVASALREKFEIPVFAKKFDSRDDYYKNIERVLMQNIDASIDDGCDLVVTAIENWSRWGKNLKFGTEETTTGVQRLRSLERSQNLKYPVIAVNDSKTKYLFDNRYGTGQSVVDGILRATNFLLAGKNVVICGFGWCGKGIAKRLQGLGARVTVVEIDPIKALEAYLEGYNVYNLESSLPQADIVVTATGNKNVIDAKHFNLLKDGVVLCNAGHFDIEINIKALASVAKRRSVEGRTEVEEYDLGGKTVFVLAEGRLVNLACAEGHPSCVMDLSFANQALAIEYLAFNHQNMEPRVYVLPEDLDSQVAAIKVKSLGLGLEELSEEQKEYLQAFKYGT